MKYINRFNEELDSNTYKRVADKFKSLGHLKRSNDLLRHGEIVKELNKLNKLTKEINTYLPYGLFDCAIDTNVKIKEEFALKIYYEDYTIEESFDEYEKDYSSCFWIKLGIVFLPIIDKEEEEYIRRHYSSEMENDDSEKHTYYVPRLEELEDTVIANICDTLDTSFYGGHFNGPDVFINMQLHDNKIHLVDMYIDEECAEYCFSIAGRKSAIKFKNFLVKLFSNEKFDYPIDDNRGTLQDAIKFNLCEQTGFSSKYKFAYSEIGDFLKKQSLNNFYRTSNFIN